MHRFDSYTTIYTISLQPLVGITQSRSAADEELLQHINQSGGTYVVDGGAGSASRASHFRRKKYIIADARPFLSAEANRAAGKGYESEKAYDNTSILFMNVENIHKVRASWELLEEACADETKWLQNLEASGWMKHLRRILNACVQIAHIVAYEDMSVLVHCSDGNISPCP